MTDAVTHQPLAGVCVTVYTQVYIQVGNTSTASDGSYTVGMLAPGSYTVQFRDCADRGYAVQYYDDEPTPQAADPVLVGTTARSGIDAALTIGGKISGTVTDAVTGDPVANECVNAMDVGPMPVASTMTSPTGTYTLTGLPPGNYKVEFGGWCISSYLPQFYNGKSSLAAADPVAVSAGNTTPNVDAVLQPGGNITGTVKSAATDQPLSGMCVQAYQADIPNTVAYATTDAAGQYRLVGLPTGVYRVGFQNCSGADYAPQFYDDRSSLSTADPVSVTAGGTRSGIDAALHLSGKITGTVTDAGTHAPIANMCVGAFDENGATAAWTTTDSAGGYTLAPLAAGSYTVGFGGCGGDDYLAQLYDDQPSLDTADPVVVSEGGTTPDIDAALRHGGKITGTVTAAATRAPIAGACVGLFATDSHFVRYTTTGANGAYMLSGIATGTYKVGFSTHGTVVSGVGECPSGPSGYATQMYNDKLEIADGDPVAVTAGVTTSGINAGLHSSTIHTLTISVAGTGSGTVTGLGIDCPGTCSHGYPSGESTTLHAATAAGSTFTGWSGGGCSGTGSCTVTLSSDQTVTATFAAVPSPPGKPTVTITAPADGTRYVQDQAVAVAYSCAAATGATLTSCAGPVASGHALDTHALGPHTFTVTATDNLASSTARSVAYTVIAKSSGDNGSAPVLTKVHQSASKWHAAGKHIPVGTTFTFSLDASAKVRFVFTQTVPGRWVGGKCVAQSRGNLRRSQCTRTIIVGVMNVNGRPGANAVRFSGRLSQSVKLRPGTYTVSITATNTAGKRSATAALTFTIVK